MTTNTTSLRTVPDLRRAAIEAQGRNPAHAARLMHAIASIKDQATPTLLTRLDTVEDHLVAWVLHMELTARKVPPCLRPRIPQVSPQSVFIEVLADLHWLVVNHPEHVPAQQKLQGAWRYEVLSEQWHGATLWAYRQTHGRRHKLAERLGLTDAMRQFTLTMPTLEQSNQRRNLSSKRDEVRQELVRYGTAHPDRSSKTSPDQMADDRLRAILTWLRPSKWCKFIAARQGA